MSFVVLDGPDGSGKSTQIRLLESHLKSSDRDVIQVREPGGTALGEDLRNILLNAPYEISAKSEAFIFNAARSQLVEEVIAPALQAGQWVLSDRFTPSTLVYQAVAGNLSLAEVEKLCNFATEKCVPDFVFILDLPVDATLERIGSRQDRIESKGRGFLEKVREGFLALAEANAWPVIDASQSIETVQQNLREQLNQ